MSKRSPPQRGISGVPHWKVELEMRGRTELTRAGVGTVLGAAETNLMVTFGEAAKTGSPYLEEEIGQIIISTLIGMGAKNPVTKRPYTEQSDISVLVASFLDRCKEKGVQLVWKGGRKLGLQARPRTPLTCHRHMRHVHVRAHERMHAADRCAGSHRSAGCEATGRRWTGTASRSPLPRSSRSRRSTT
jgi:hypothetical protein